VLIVLEAVAMIVFIVVDVISVANDSATDWVALSFALVVLGLWAAGLVWVARGVVRGKRWAFTPTLFTQLIFGVIAVSVFGAAGTAARVVWATVLSLAVVVLRLLFSREAREHLVYSNAKQ
jgi:uncharacterized membrane protein